MVHTVMCKRKLGEVKMSTLYIILSFLPSEYIMYIPYRQFPVSGIAGYLTSDSSISYATGCLLLCVLSTVQTAL